MWRHETCELLASTGYLKEYVYTWLQELIDVAGPLIKEQCRDMADFDRDSSTKFSFSNFSFKVCKLALNLEV